MARTILAATIPQTGALDTNRLAEYRASVTFDLWSLGCVLFHLILGRSLWQSAEDGSIADEGDFRTLCGWSHTALNSKLRRAVKGQPSMDQKTAMDLLFKLLEPNAATRLAHFSESESCVMLGVLDHPFFLSKSLDDATLQSIAHGQELLAAGQEHIAASLSPLSELGSQVQHMMAELQQRTRDEVERLVDDVLANRRAANDAQLAGALQYPSRGSNPGRTSE
jgi:serine/threonine protein kinase